MNHFYNHRARAKRCMSRGKARGGDPEEAARQVVRLR